MQSSPPHRTWNRPSSPAESQYSLNLDALELDSPNGTSTPLPQQHIDTVRSEDIDGPSDFTLNMGDWMRGGSLRKGKAASQKDMQNIPLLEEEESVMSDNDRPGVPGLRLDRVEGKGDAEEHTASHHTPTNSPPRDSTLLSSLPSGKALLPSPKLDDKSSLVSGRHPDRPHFLQPTVEDDYSELTPGRLPSVWLDKLSPDLGSTSDRVDRVTLEGLLRDSSSPAVQAPTVQLPSDRKFSSQTDEANFQQTPDEVRYQQADLESRCRQLQRLNSVLNKTIEDERRLREQDSVMYKSRLADSARLDSSLASMQSEHTRAIDTLRKAHARELQELRDQIDSDRSEHSRKVRSLQQDLDLTRISRDNAEQLAKNDREELEELREVHDVEMDGLGHHMRQIEQLNAQISELNEQFRALNLDHADLAARAKDAEGVITNLRAELALSKQMQNEQVARATADIQRAVDRAEELQGQINEFQTRLNDEQGAHNTELKRIESEQPPAETVASDELQLWREQLEMRQSELNSALIDRDAAQDELDCARSNLEKSETVLQGLRSELETLKHELSDSKEVNLAMDVRISEAIRRRENYWQARLEAMEKEKMLMGKALMNQWGREEVGAEEPRQRYLYHYLQPRGKGVRDTQGQRSKVLSTSLG